MPGLRRVAAVSLVLAALSAVTIVVQAVALAHVVERSLLHHESLSGVAPALVLVGVAVLVRAGLQAAGELSAHGAAERVVTQLRGELLEHALTLGPGWLAGERPGELSVTATRGLRSLHTYYAALPAPSGGGRAHPRPAPDLGGQPELARLPRRDRAGARRPGHHGVLRT